MYDVVIIGAGVIGCAIARSLSKYKMNVCVIDKEDDIGCGTTKANSAIIHAGYDAVPGSLKAKFNLLGNKKFDMLSKELDFQFKRIGSFVLAFDNEDLTKLNELLIQGKKNGVKDLCIIDGKKIKELEPNINENVLAVLYAPSAGIVCPFEMTIALAENAFLNGVEFKLDTEVTGINKTKDLFIISTNNGNIKSKIIINSAGVFSDKVSNMISNNKIHIIPRKGEYCLFDKNVGDTVSRIIFQVPNKNGKGVLVTPTVHGNLLIGPNAIDIEDKYDTNTSKLGMDEILNKAKLSIKEIPIKNLITYFAGLRAHSIGDDFIIGESKDVENFINVAGIDSPGLTCAPAIGEFVENIILSKLNLVKKEDYIVNRKKTNRFRDMNNLERNELIKQDSFYGNIVCRCEMVTEGEIIDAIRRPLGAKNIDGIKRRTRAGMGRCQSGFCTTKIIKILSRELNISSDNVTKNGKKSNLIVGKNKGMY